MEKGKKESKNKTLQDWLVSAPSTIFVAYACLAAFATYFCMYAFRKPFAAAKYEGLMFFGTDVNLNCPAN